MFSAHVKHMISTDDISGFFGKRLQVHVLRLDRIDPLISGNKWFKLRYHLQKAIRNQQEIVTYGGAWSNHLLATAALCARSGIGCTGIVRGERPAVLSATLVECERLGMKLVFISRECYREKNLPPAYDTAKLHLIPEGGHDATGALGAQTIHEYISPVYTHLCCAVGTGTMMAGLINGADASRTAVLGVSVMKNNASLPGEIEELVTKPGVQHQLVHGYEARGYARYDQRLINFMNQLYRDTGVPTDFVYTGKLFLAIQEMIDGQRFAPGSSLLLIHSGGLAGNAGLPNGTLMY